MVTQPLLLLRRRLAWWWSSSSFTFLLLLLATTTTTTIAGPTLKQEEKKTVKRPLFKVVSLPQASEKYDAYCLDGTPASYLIRPGHGDGAKKFLLYHEGGGWCYSGDSCIDRSTSYFGTSGKKKKSKPETAEEKKKREAAKKTEEKKAEKKKGDKPSQKHDPPPALGYYDYEKGMYGNEMSSDPATNPMLYNWNHVLFHYCDGSSFTGNAVGPRTFLNGTQPVNLWFAGHRVHEVILQDLLDNRGLWDATDVVLTGSSAGALAVILKADHIKSRLNPKTKVVGLPDSGFFWEHNVMPPKNVFGPPCRHVDNTRWVYDHHESASGGVNEDCLAYYGAMGEAWKCMFAQNILPFVRVPLFVIQSRYDSYTTATVFCRFDNDTVGINHDSKAMISALTQSLSASIAGIKHGLVVDGCWHHAQNIGTMRVFGPVIGINAFDVIPTVHSQVSFHQAFASWYESLDESETVITSKEQNESLYWEICEAPYPCASCCGSRTKKHNY